MDPIHRKTLQKLRPDLKKSLEVANLWDELVARGVFSEDMAAEYRSHQSRGKQADQLLLNLPKRGPRAYELFLECLADTDQGHIRQMILNQEATLRGQPLPPTPMDEDVTDFTPTSGVLDLKVTRTTDEFVQNFNKDVQHYRMSSRPRGYALLINNRKFGYMSERVGTEIDGTNLENLLKQLGYRVEQKRELTAQEIKTAVRQFSVKPQLNQVDSCIFAIMTHGENGEVYGVDDELVPLDSIVQLFEGEHCPALVNKPKMFIIQACRGKKKDAGFAGFDATDSVPPAEMEKTISEFQRLSIDDVAVLKQKLPTLSDTLIAYSTIPGYVSWRNTKTGSWFIQCICEIFAEHAHHEDALSLLTMVNNKMSRAFGTKFKQTPAPVFTLRKKFFFFPGL